MRPGRGISTRGRRGGAGADKIACKPLDENDSVQIEGGSGDDAIIVSLGNGNDTVIIDAGPGDDTITYDVSPGKDTAFINGGTGTDTLTLNQNGLPVVIQDNNANVIYQYGIGGTTITVVNVEHISVVDEVGNTLFTWNAP